MAASPIGASDGAAATADAGAGSERVLGSVSRDVGLLSWGALRDDTPNMGPAPASLLTYDLDASNLVAFAEAAGVAPTFAAELGLVNKLEALASEGRDFVSVLYSFRGCAAAIPMAGADMDETGRNRMHLKVFTALRPEVLKLLELARFADRLLETLVEVLPELKPANRRAAFPHLFDVYAQCLDVLLLLDSLTVMKSSLSNMFTRYKRSFGVMKGDIPGADAMEADHFYLAKFLNDPEYGQAPLYMKLKVRTAAVEGHAAPLLATLHHCAQRVNDHRYVLPRDKHMLVRVMALLFLLLDKPTTDPKKVKQTSVFYNKAIRGDNVFSLFKKYPVIPMFGDMPIQLSLLLMRAESYNPETASIAIGDSDDEKRAQKAAQLSRHWRKVRDDHNAFMTRFALVVNEVKLSLAEPDSAGLVSVDESTIASASETALEGLQMLSDWSALVLEESAWKHSHAAEADSAATHPHRGLAAAAGDEPTAYELVVRYNYSPAEVSVLVDMVAAIKSTAAALSDAAPLIVPLLRMDMHSRIQRFLHGPVTEMLHRAHKGKKSQLEAALLALRDVAAEWPMSAGATGIAALKALYRDKKSAAKSKAARDGSIAGLGPDGVVTTARRACAPSPTQVSALRVAVETLIDAKSEARAKGGLMSGRFMKDKELAACEDILHRLTVFPALADFTGSIAAASNLGDLWFRELFLDMAHKPQFPIEMSLPWIVARHAIQCHSAATLESVLYVLDIYNDAAHQALYVMSQRFLYDEIEAELNLVFGQLVFLFSDVIYSDARDYVTGLSLEPAYREAREAAADGEPPLQRPAARLHVALAQRHVHLLGRSLNMNRLIGEHVNNYLRRDIDSTVKRLELDELSGIVEFEYTMGVLKGTHALLARSLSLDDFAMMRAEVEEAVSVSSAVSRVSAHILSVVVEDLLPHFAYNGATQRFLRCPSSLSSSERRVETKERRRARARVAVVGPDFRPAVGFAFRTSHSYVSAAHADAIVRALGTDGVALLVRELMIHVEAKVAGEIALYFPTLVDGLPPTPLPSYRYRFGGCFAYFEAKLRGLLEYEDLRPRVFQALREVGNALAFVSLVHNAQVRADVHAAVALGSLNGDVKPGAGTSGSDDGASLATTVSELVSRATRDEPPGVASGSNATVHPLSATGEGGIPVKSHFTLRPLAANAERGIDATSRQSTATPVLPWAIARLAAALDTAADDDDDGAAAGGFGSDDDGSATGPRTLRDVWQTDGRGGSGLLIDTNSTPEFFRLWSALLFLYCMPVPQDSFRPPDDREFGDGFVWAGTALVYLLGQAPRFELADFVSHVLNVFEYEEGEDNDADFGAAGAAGAGSPSSAGSGGSGGSGMRRMSRMLQGKSATSQVGEVDEAVKKQARVFSRVARAARTTWRDVFTLLRSTTPPTAQPPESRFSAMEFLPPDDDVVRSSVPSMGASKRNLGMLSHMKSMRGGFGASGSSKKGGNAAFSSTSVGSGTDSDAAGGGKEDGAKSGDAGARRSTMAVLDSLASGGQGGGGARGGAAAKPKPAPTAPQRKAAAPPAPPARAAANAAPKAAAGSNPFDDDDDDDDDGGGGGKPGEGTNPFDDDDDDSDDASKPAAAATGGGGGVTVKKDPQLAKYFRLIALGMAREHIELKMSSEGFDPKLLDTPDAPSPYA